MEQNNNNNYINSDFNEGRVPGASGDIRREYIVEEKDTLPELARKYGVSIEEIMAANQDTIKEPSDLMHPGTRILIPNKGPR